MKNLLYNNTYNQGSMTFIVVKEKNNYVGVCLEFDLVTEDKNPKIVMEKIEDYARGWLKNVVKSKLSEELLNKPAPKKYWKIYEKVLSQGQNKLKAQPESPVHTHTPIDQLLGSWFKPYDPSGLSFI